MAIGDYLTLLRPRQWIKNAFVAAPLFFTPNAVSGSNVWAVAVGFLAFSMLASAVYCLNDLRDREADRGHPVKKSRPLAAGTVSPAGAIVMMVALLAGAFALSLWLAPAVLPVLAAYFAFNVAYSLYLKSVPIVDVMIVALGFVLRVEAGALLIGADPSAWILIVTGLLSLFIALAKRRDDLVRELDSRHRGSLDGYTKQFLDGCIHAMLAALLVSYLVFTTDEAVMARMGSDRLYLTGPFVIAGVLRYLQLTVVYERSGSPTDLAFSDRGLQLSVAGWLATFSILLYL